MNDAVLRYRSAMAFALGLLRDQVITEEEYEQIDRIIAKKHNVNSGSIFCRNPLILQGFRANMSPTKGGGDSNGAQD